jgi:RimJ/RimL family protein N-acetyltransferase
MLRDFDLRGEEVYLRPLVMSDAEALAEAAAEARDTYGLTAVPNGLDEAHRYIQEALDLREAGIRFAFTTIWRDRVVGTTGYWELQPWKWPDRSPMQRVDRPDVVEVGSTWLAASAQRTRCNTESKYLLFAHAFDVWEVHRVSLRTDARNARSRAAIERLGAKFEGIRRADLPGEDGSVRDSAYFSVVRAEWPEVRARLRAFLGS